MNFTRIEYFLAAAKYLNFTKAANVLYISQPSLSKQIALLEDELGVTLFNRLPRALQLTPAGKLLNYEFNRLMPEIDAITEKVKRLRDESIKTLFLGCVESIHLGTKASEAIRSYTSKSKDVEFFIERYDFETLNSKLTDGSIDIAFTISTEIGKMKDIVTVQVDERERYIIMSTEHRLAVKEDIKISDLRDEVFVLHGKAISQASSDDLIEVCAKYGFHPKIRYAHDIDALLDYVEFVDGIAFQDKSITENRLGRLKYFPTEEKKRFDLICMWKKGNKNPALKEFVAHFPNA
ncbi:MAG: LysR family transcriptional regulator [Oscillospiraceae bacterium]|nr:LysR family transcriptional regulator [Oscillospiraceae bacterium]